MISKRTVLSIVTTGTLALTLAATSALWSAPVQAQASTPTAIAAPATATLSAEEASDLQFMREEEKLARDVYLTLNETWNLQVFANISQAEQTHMDAVLTVLDAYGVDDPAAGNEIGVFTDPDLQALYDQLVATGNQSVLDALHVGAAIEEIDILDLDERMERTDNADILQLYANLEQGSESHLRAFASNIERQTGEAYQPQYMEQAEYDAILSGSNGHGQRGGSQGAVGQAGQGQGSHAQGGHGRGGHVQGGRGQGGHGQGGQGQGTHDCPYQS